ncbi:MAG TPA: hypothetical protein VHV77_03515 [Pirellulales bacterium]|jgi:hypothetical protein|nr:hypothetical protein [Pirellulales bacterium]
MGRPSLLRRSGFQKSAQQQLVDTSTKPFSTVDDDDWYAGAIALDEFGVGINVDLARGHTVALERFFSVLTQVATVARVQHDVVGQFAWEGRHRRVWNLRNGTIRTVCLTRMITMPSEMKNQPLVRGLLEL